MIEEKVKLFNYKGRDIIVGRKGSKYIIGITGSNSVDLWFETYHYNTLELAITSGREYARIRIDKMLLAQRKEALKNEKPK